MGLSAPPEQIIVNIEYEPRTDYYVLQIAKFLSIQRVSLEGIYRFFEDQEKEDQEKYFVAYWTATKNGHQLEWIIDGAEFMDRVKTKIIDESSSHYANDCFDQIESENC